MHGIHCAATLFWVDRESIHPHDGLMPLIGLVASTTGPPAEDFLSRAAACAAKHCEGIGKCIPVGVSLVRVHGWACPKCERSAAHWVGHLVL